MMLSQEGKGKQQVTQALMIHQLDLEKLMYPRRHKLLQIVQQLVLKHPHPLPRPM
jgi:hypothetical protein